MKKFFPQRVLIERKSLDYPLGQELEAKFKKTDVPVNYIDGHNQVRPEEKMEPKRLFNWTKETLVVGVKKTLRFKSCQPSADYRVVIGTSCPGRCEYCYLAKNLGASSYIRVYVNLAEIKQAVQKHIDKTDQKPVTFEASSSSDPVAVEHLTGSLAELIRFFSTRKEGYLRVVTKFSFVDPLIELDHQRQTRFRFSLNTPYIVDTFEHLTSGLDERLKAAAKIQKADYPTGFIIAPLIIYPAWQEDYKQLLERLKKRLPKPERADLSFELIMYRFSTRSKNLIKQRFPQTQLNLDKEDYYHKGFGKYVYPEEEASRLKESVTGLIKNIFPQAEVEYFT